MNSVAGPVRLGAALLSVVVGAGVVASAQQRPAFRAGVELVSLNVTVTQSGGRYVSDLSETDFTVLEDGQPQELVFFSRANMAMAVSLLIDSSASMDRQLQLAQNAAVAFVSRLRDGDVAEIIEFSNRVHVRQSFTGDRQALEEAIRSVRAGGSTALYNAVYIALKQIEQLRAPDRDQPRREVIVVLSDGEDTSSLLTFDELLEAAKHSHTVIYTIGLGLDSSRRPQSRMDPEFVLRRLAQETGGRLFLAKQANQLASVYNEIADELTSQYVLGYLSSHGGAAGWRSVSVRVGRPNHYARTRPGYFSAN
jgi:Ca-activated chloride channel homolog